MEKITTFEDVFNKIIDSFKGQRVEIHTRQEGISLARLSTRVDRITINPAEDFSEKKKIGLISLQRKVNNHFETAVNIPFILGFDTMQAYFTNQGSLIKTLNLEFKIRKTAERKKRLA
ncbi:MAG: hypothetical protein ACOC5A_03910 [Halanaerobiales bacterium]